MLFLSQLVRQCLSLLSTFSRLPRHGLTHQYISIPKTGLKSIPKCSFSAQDSFYSHWSHTQKAAWQTLLVHSTVASLSLLFQCSPALSIGIFLLKCARGRRARDQSPRPTSLQAKNHGSCHTSCGSHHLGGVNMKGHILQTPPTHTYQQGGCQLRGFQNFLLSPASSPR